MKKIITLLLSAGIFTASYAQKDYDTRDYGRNDQYSSDNYGRHDRDNRDRNDHYDRDRYDTYRMQADRINREYNYRVMSIEQDQYMSRRERKMALRQAEKERDYQLQMMRRNGNGYAANGYGDNYGHHGDHDGD